MKKLLSLLFFIPFFCFSQENTSTPVIATYNDVITKTVRGELQTYIARSGERFSVGDTITIGAPFRNEIFTFIRQNAVVETYPLVAQASGSIVIIKKITSRSKLVQISTTHSKAGSYQLWVNDLESAIEKGEIKSKIMSSDDALQELKKCKDKLDLGLITQEEFDLKKAELSKLIK